MLDQITGFAGLEGATEFAGIAIDSILLLHPEYLWVGLGLPKQERWMFDHQDRLNVPVLVGVGAAFKFVSGQVSRAPVWVGNSGFEWLWRFAREPRRVWRRVMIDGPHFLFCVAFEKLDSGKRGKTK